MERATKKVKVRLLNGEEREVEIYSYINIFERREILKKVIKESRLKGNDIYVDLDFAEFMTLILEKIWADKEVKLSDVCVKSLDKVLEEYMPFFLAGAKGP